MRRTRLITGVRLPDAIGFGFVQFADRMSIRIEPGQTLNDVVTPAERRLFDLVFRRSEWARRVPPPDGVLRYWDGWRYREPTGLGLWEWSDTFGRWGRVCTFDNSLELYTWPDYDEQAAVHRRMYAELEAEIQKLEDGTWTAQKNT